MKIKKLALTAFSACYMASAMAATNLWEPEKSELPSYILNEKVPELFSINEAVSRQSAFQTNRLTGLKTTSSLQNQVVTPTVKFIPETDIYGTDRYIVVLKDSPVPMYRGGVKGLIATNLQVFSKSNANTDNSESMLTSITSWFSNDNSVTTEQITDLKQIKKSNAYQEAVSQYQSYLMNKQQTFISHAQNINSSILVERQFTQAINGMTLVMSQEDAIELAQLQNVKAIARAKLVELASVDIVKGEVDGAEGERNQYLRDVPSGHSVIGADLLWAKGIKGEGIIVGVGDTGINTDHPSFQDFGEHPDGYTDKSGITWQSDDPFDHTNPWGTGNYVGDCAKAEFFDMCNDKLIGVRSYDRITDLLNSTEMRRIATEKGVLNLQTIVPKNGEDYQGHGSHTSGTTAGNSIKDVHYKFREFLPGPGVNGSKDPLGSPSGIAPRANIIMYQICIPSLNYGGCMADVMINALEDAITDGVDVINWSLGGGAHDPWTSPTFLAMLSARESGISIAAAAGNAGAISLVKNVAPWVMTVGATDMNRKDVPSNYDALLTNATFPAMRDGLDYEMSFQERAISISGEVSGPVFLAENNGTCLESSCAEIDVCPIGRDNIDGTCYLTCDDETEYRDIDTLQCTPIPNNEPSTGGDTSNNCKRGEILVDGNCELDINTITANESICDGEEYAIYDALFTSKFERNHYACTGVQIAPLECVDSHIGKTGASSGLCCANGVYPDDAVDSELDPSGETTTDNLVGACCSDTEGCPYVRDQGLTGTIKNESFSDKLARDYLISGQAQNDIDMIISKAKTRTSLNVIDNGVPTYKTRYSRDHYCENVEQWTTYNEMTGEAEPFNFDGAIIACARGSGDNISLLEKANNVANACTLDSDNQEKDLDKCAAGIVIYNNDISFKSNSRIEQASHIPLIHIGNATWLNELKTFFAAGNNHQLTIPSTYREIVYDGKKISDLASYSSLGPHFVVPGLMAPSVIAPGSNIYAPYSDEAIFSSGSHSADWAFTSGTSMATPHVAGALALLKQAQPNWSASERESALMLTASSATHKSLNRIYEDEYDESNPDHHKSEAYNAKRDIETGEILYDDEGNVLVELQTFYWIRSRPPATWAGTGLINVNHASEAALVLNETTERMIAANPFQGGDTRQLNMAYLFDDACPSTCSWIRTFTAKRSGSWNIITDNFEASINVNASMDHFSLEAGQSISIVFSAEIIRSMTEQSTGTGFAFGEIQLISVDDDSIPDTRLPVGVSLESLQLPQRAYGVANTDKGVFPIDVSRPNKSTDTLQSNVYQSGQLNYLTTNDDGSIAIDEHSVEYITDMVGGTWLGLTSLPLDNTGRYSFANRVEPIDQASTKVFWIDVPEGTKMLSADVLANYETTIDKGTPDNLWKRGEMHVLIGHDVIEPNVINYEEEALCISNTDLALNNCFVMNPKPGRYWVYLENVNDDAAGRDDGTQRDVFKYAISLVTDEISTDFQLDAPLVLDGVYGVGMDVVYDVTLNPGDVIYATAELGTSEQAIGDIGIMPIRLTRDKDTVSMTLNKEKVTPGSYIRVDVDLAINHTGYDRNFQIKVLPQEGVKFVVGSVGGDPRFVSGFEQDIEGLTIDGIQPNTYRWADDYIITTNLNPDSFPDDTDLSNNLLAQKYSGQCRTPNLGPYPDGTNSNGGYFDLAKLGGIFKTPYTGADEELALDSWKDTYYIDLPQIYSFQKGVDFNTHNSAMRYSELRVSPMGFIKAGTDFPDLGLPVAMNFGENFQTFPDIIVAPLVRGGIDNLQNIVRKKATDFLLNEDYEGISMSAYTDIGSKVVLIEWDNAFILQGNRFGGSQGVRVPDSEVDFQVWMDLEYNNLPGAYEFIYAYDNLNLLNAAGSVGLHGFSGFRGVSGPTGGYKNYSLAYNNLDTALQDNLVICMDYIGDNYSESQYWFYVRVDNDIAGETIDVEIEVTLDAVSSTLIKTLEVPGNINIAPMQNVTMFQGEILDVLVQYTDKNLTKNIIDVTSDNLSLSVNGNDSGSILSIDTQCSFTGDDTVTVKVIDGNNDNDFAQTTFNVTVNEVADYSSANNCSTQSNEEEPELVGQESAESSGGTTNILMVLFMMLVASRRKLMTK